MLSRREYARPSVAEESATQIGREVKVKSRANLINTLAGSMKPCDGSQPSVRKDLTVPFWSW